VLECKCSADEPALLTYLYRVTGPGGRCESLDRDRQRRAVARRSRGLNSALADRRVRIAPTLAALLEAHEGEPLAHRMRHTLLPLGAACLVLVWRRGLRKASTLIQSNPLSTRWLRTNSSTRPEDTPVEVDVPSPVLSVAIADSFRDRMNRHHSPTRRSRVQSRAIESSRRSLLPCGPHRSQPMAAQNVREPGRVRDSVATPSVQNPGPARPSPANTRREFSAHRVQHHTPTARAVCTRRPNSRSQTAVRGRSCRWCRRHIGTSNRSRLRPRRPSSSSSPTRPLHSLHRTGCLRSRRLHRSRHAHADIHRSGRSPSRP